MRAWGTRGSQRVVPRPVVLVSLGNLLEMFPSTKSETPGVGSAICVLIHPPGDSDGLPEFENQCCKPPHNSSSYFSARCRTETCGCLRGLIPGSPSRRQALHICLHVLGGDGSKPIFCNSWEPLSLYCDSYSDMLSFLSSVKTILSLH